MRPRAPSRCADRIVMRFSLSFLNQLFQAGFCLSLLLVCLDFLAFFFFPDTFFHRVFIATKEQTPLTWLSVVAFLLIALGAWSVAWERRSFRWGWLASVFAFFSLDDAIYLHERIAGYFRSHTLAFEDFPSYLWVILYSPLLIGSLGALLFLLFRRATPGLRSLVVLAAAALAAAFGLDFLDGLIQRGTVDSICATQSCHFAWLHLMRLIEETLEVWAIGLLGYLLLREYCLVTPLAK